MLQNWSDRRMVTKSFLKGYVTKRWDWGQNGILAETIGPMSLHLNGSRYVFSKLVTP